MEPLWSLSARFTFSDIVVIPGQSYLRCVDSRVPILTRYMLDPLYVPMELSLSHQDRSGTSDTILGHILLI